MTIDCEVYGGDQRRRALDTDVTPEALVHALKDIAPGEFLWVAAGSPSPGQLQAVGEALRLHPLAIEDMLDIHPRPKMERYHDYLLICLHAVQMVDGRVRAAEVNICAGSDFVVTVCRGESPVATARAQLAADPDRLEHGPIAAVHAVLDQVVDGYDAVAAALEGDVEDVEATVFSDRPTRDSQRIYWLKREVLEFRRAVMPLREPLDRLAHSVGPDAARPYFRDVADHLHRAGDTIEMIDNLLDNALTAHLAQLSVQQNDDMRKLTAGATLFAVPTAIAGIYGMNFRFMPELNWPYGYPVVLGTMLTLCGYIYYRFKRSGWL